MGLPGHQNKFVRLVKTSRIVVFRVDDKSEGAYAECIGTHGGVHNERATEATAAMVDMNREPAQEHRRHGWIAW
jgi:hypothetical protein